MKLVERYATVPDAPGFHRPCTWRRLIFCIGLLSVAFVQSCGQTPNDAKVETRVDRFSEQTPRDRYADDVGRFLAGLPPKPGSSLAKLHEANAWLKHQRDLDDMWNHFEKDSLVPMRAFQQQELRTVADSRVFYPFSGPDTLIVTTFFPRSPVYVMVGLEPAGTLPTPKQLERTDLEKYLPKVRLTVASELGRSFFITRQMDRQFRGQVTNGLIEPILELLVRSNHTILGFRYIRLDDAGSPVDRTVDERTPDKSRNKGVEIDFQTDSDGSVHKVFYLSVNLADQRLSDNMPFLSFLSMLKRSTTYLKATSYMTHKPTFSLIRDQILSISAVILQDDSGIPYHFFQAPMWRVQLYGTYDRPYGSFRWLQQQDLKKAYQTAGPKALDFRIGYGYGKVPSNLLLATRAE